MDTHCVNLEIRKFYRIYVEAPRGSTKAEILDKARSAALEDERNLIEDEELDLESQDIYTPTAKVPIAVCEKTRSSVIRYVIRKILESMNDVLDGKIPSPVIKTPTKEE